MANFRNDAPFKVRKHIQLINGVNSATITGDETLTVASSTFQFLSGGGSDYDVNLPAEEDGIYFWIVNTGPTNDLVVKDLSPATIETITPGKGALLVCDGVAWRTVISA